MWDTRFVLNAPLQQWEFLVKWVGYHEGHNSWLPAKQCEHALEAISDFYQENPEAVGREQYFEPVEDNGA